MPEVKTRRGVFTVSERAAREVAATKKRKRYKLPASWWESGVAERMAEYVKRANGDSES